MVGYKVAHTFVTALYQTAFKQPFDFSDFIEIASTDGGVGYFSFGAKPLQGTVAYFQESAYLKNINQNLILNILAIIQYGK